MKELKLLVSRTTAYPLRLPGVLVNGVALPGAMADAGVAGQCGSGQLGAKVSVGTILLPRTSGAFRFVNLHLVLLKVIAQTVGLIRVTVGIAVV